MGGKEGNIMGKNNSMTFVAKMLTDRDLFGNSMSIAKTVKNSKASKNQRAEYVVFCEDVTELANVAFRVFRERMSTVANADSANAMHEFNDSEELRNAMFSAISAIIDDIGEIGEGKLIANAMIYAHAVESCYKFYDEYHGKALLIKSQLANYKKTMREYMDSPSGVNAEAITSTNANIERLEAELSELRKKPGMVTLEWRQANSASFVADMEKYLCKLIKRQLPMSADEFKAAKKAAKDATNNKRNSAKK